MFGEDENIEQVQRYFLPNDTLKLLHIYISTHTKAIRMYDTYIYIM